MTHEEYKNKYGCKDVSNYEIYDNYGNLITIINTVNSDELQITKKGRHFLRIKDALVNTEFLNYITHNSKFDGSIKAKTIYRGIDGNDRNVYIDAPKVKLLNYKLKNVVGEVGSVNFLFELFVSQRHGYAIDYKVE